MILSQKKRKGLGNYQADMYDKAHQKVFDYLKKVGIPECIYMTDEARKKGYRKESYREIARVIGSTHKTVKNHMDKIKEERKGDFYKHNGRWKLYDSTTSPADLMQTFVLDHKVEKVPLVAVDPFGSFIRFLIRSFEFIEITDSILEFARETYKDKNWDNEFDMIANLKEILPPEVKVTYVFDRNKFIKRLEEAVKNGE